MRSKSKTCRSFLPGLIVATILIGFCPYLSVEADASTLSVNSLTVTAPATVTSGSSFSLTITAKDVNGNATTNVTATTYLSTNYGIIMPRTIADTSFQTNGTYTGTFTITGIVENTAVVLTVQNDTVTGTAGITVNKATLSGNSYYLSTTGNDSNSGTSTTSAWATLDHASYQLHAGDTLYVLPGTYTRQTGCMANSGTAANPIVITAYSTMPVFDGVDYSLNGFYFNSKDHVIVNKLKFRRYSQTVLGFGCYTYLTNSDVGECQSDDIINLSGHYYSQQRGGASLHDVFLLNNKIHDTAVLEYDPVPNMIDIQGAITDNGESTAYNIFLANNDIYGSTYHETVNIISENPGYQLEQRSGIGLRDLVIENNKIHDLLDNSAAIYTIHGTAEYVTIRNNEMYGIPKSCIEGSFSHSIIEGNYIHDEWEGWGIWLIDTGIAAQDTTIKNNRIDYWRGMLVGMTGNVTVTGNTMPSYTTSGNVYTIADERSASFDVWEAYGTSTNVEFTYNRIVDTSLSGDNPRTLTGPRYYTSKCSMNFVGNASNWCYLTVTPYPACAVPASDYLTITPNTIDRSADTWDFDVASTVPENPTTFTLETLHPNMTYAVRRDNTQIATAYTDNTGKLAYTYSVAGSEFGSSHNFKFVSTGQPAPNTYVLTVTGGTGSGTYAQGTVVTIVAGTAPSGKTFDQWTGDTSYAADIHAASTTVTMPAAAVHLTAAYRDVAAPAPNTYTFIAPSPASGVVGAASGNFTVTPAGNYTGTITVTPSGGGLSAPVTLNFSNSAAAQTFTITPVAAGAIILTPTNSGGLADPSAVTYTAYMPGTLRNESRNYPNPVNFSKTDKTTIAYTVAEECSVYICLYSFAGDLVKVLVDERTTTPGKYYVDWYGDNGGGEKVASGVYLYVAKIGKDIIKKKIVLVR